MKTSPDFFAIWGGISGIQHGFPLLISDLLKHEVAGLPLLARVLAANVAQRFRLPGKGRIAAGHDADFTLLDLESEHVLSNDELLYRHQQGPYAGRKCQVRVMQTFVRGCPVWADGQMAPDTPKGHFIRPKQ